MKKNIYILSLFLLYSPYSVMADVTLTDNQLPYWYAGAGIGLSHYDNAGNSITYDGKEDNLAGSVYAGYQMSPYLASELGYQFLGGEKGNNAGNFQQVALMARLGYPVTASFYPYAKIGGTGWFGESNGLNSTTGKGFSPAAGVGFEYAFTPRLIGRMEYQYTDELGNESLGYTDHHLTTVGLTWRFGISSHVAETPRFVHEAVSFTIPSVAEVEPEAQQTESKNTQSLFAFNSSILTDKAAFRDVLAFLQQHPSAVAIITGYTDNIGSEQYNQRLSERRANAVATYFTSQGIDAVRLTSIGKGEQEPIADNATETGRAMNRRVEITVPAFTLPKAN